MHPSPHTCVVPFRPRPSCGPGDPGRSAASRSGEGSQDYLSLEDRGSQIAQDDFTNNLFKLLTETFDGPPIEGGSAYLDKGAGLFQTLGSLSADAASREPTPGSPTIAGHCAHIGYYMRVLHAFAVGLEPELDWPSS